MKSVYRRAGLLILSDEQLDLNEQLDCRDFREAVLFEEVEGDIVEVCGATAMVICKTSNLQDVCNIVREQLRTKTSLVLDKDTFL